MSEDIFYREHIMDHFHHPRNFGHLDNPDISHEEDNPLCGDRIGLDLRLADGKIVAVAFYGRGCAISQASASLLTERLSAISLEEARQIGKAEVLSDLGIPISPARLKCALLALQTLQAGLGGASKPEEGA